MRRRSREVVCTTIALGVMVYFGVLLGYGTFAWIQRVCELSRGGNGSGAISLAVIGTVVSLLPFVVVVGVRWSGSKMRARAAALYGLGLSMPLLIVLTVAYNI